MGGRPVWGLRALGAGASPSLPASVGVQESLWTLRLQVHVWLWSLIIVPWLRRHPTCRGPKKSHPTSHLLYCPNLLSCAWTYSFKEFITYWQGKDNWFQHKTYRRIKILMGFFFLMSNYCLLVCFNFVNILLDTYFPQDSQHIVLYSWFPLQSVNVSQQFFKKVCVGHVQRDTCKC